MALYDNKLWLLSHIRNSFISTDDTGMCEMVMVGEDIPKHLGNDFDEYRDPDDSEEDEDDIQHESYDIQLDMDFGVHRLRSNTAVRLEKLDQAKKRMSKIKNIKWEYTEPLSEEELKAMFVKKEPKKKVVTKSLLSEQLEKCVNLPQNQYMEYAKFDGSAQIGIPTRKYKIFLTMLPEEQRNYPMIISCIATAKIQEFIGLILLKCSMSHGDFPLGPVESYGLYITEEDGEVDHDFPCLDPKECVAKFGFNCLGLVEHKQGQKSVSFEDAKQIYTGNEFGNNTKDSKTSTSPVNETKKITEDMKIMKVHKTAMEAPLYKSYQVFIVNKVRAKTEIHLGISGEKIEIDPVQQKSSKFSLVRQKPVSLHIDSVVWCEITDTKSSGSAFRVYYTPLHGYMGNISKGDTSVHQQSATFKYYDFESDHSTTEEIVEKINLILDLHSSLNRKEYLAAREKKLLKKKSSTSNRI